MKQTLRNGRHRIEASVEIYVVKEGRYWTVVSPALRVSGYGKTEEEAQASFKIEMDLFFEEATEKGSLAHLLISYGWTLSNKFAIPPSVNVPVELLPKDGSGFHRGNKQVAIFM
ncbi:MAG: hypothetical protein IPP83_15300 [Flavobacteriales bacterium]|nr:hypothetical protein [Flavobacteriales bacterium]